MARAGTLPYPTYLRYVGYNLGASRSRLNPFVLRFDRIESSTLNWRFVQVSRRFIHRSRLMQHLTAWHDSAGMILASCGAGDAAAADDGDEGGSGRDAAGDGNDVAARKDAEAREMGGTKGGGLSKRGRRVWKKLASRHERQNS